MSSQASLTRKATADGAQALWTGSRNIPQAWFRHADAAHIRNMAARVSALNSRAQHHATGFAQYIEQDKKYSLSDLRRAYDMGFYASGVETVCEHYERFRELSIKEFK